MLCLGDDCQLLIWDLGSQGLYSSHASSAQSRSPHPDGSNSTSGSTTTPNSTAQTRATSEPLLAYDAPAEITNVAWSPNLVGGAYTKEDGSAAIAPRGEWVAIAAGRSVRALKV